MIALDPEFLGGFAPQSQPSEGTDQATMSFARQPRLHRLHIQGKADETEDASEDDLPTRDRDRAGKRKMRGKDKSLKRLVNHI